MFFFFRFVEAKNKVKERYTAIENELLAEFSRAQVRGDKKAMKKYIKLLSKFKVNSLLKVFQMKIFIGFSSGPQRLHSEFHHRLSQSEKKAFRRKNFPTFESIFV